MPPVGTPQCNHFGPQAAFEINLNNLERCENVTSYTQPHQSVNHGKEMNYKTIRVAPFPIYINSLCTNLLVKTIHGCFFCTWDTVFSIPIYRNKYPRMKCLRIFHLHLQYSFWSKMEQWRRKGATAGNTIPQ